MSETNYKRLVVWQKAITFVGRIEQSTETTRKLSLHADLWYRAFITIAAECRLDSLQHRRGESLRETRKDFAMRS